MFLLVYNEATPLERGNCMEEKDVRVIFARNLNDMMRDNNVSRAEVAKVTGASISAVGTWCTGVKIPRMDKVEKLANYFHCLKSDLIEEKTNSPAPKKDTREWLEDLLVERGWIRRGEDITPAQAKFLIGMATMMDAFWDSQSEK